MDMGWTCGESRKKREIELPQAGTGKSCDIAMSLVGTSLSKTHLRFFGVVDIIITGEVRSTPLA